MLVWPNIKNAKALISRIVFVWSYCGIVLACSGLFEMDTPKREDTLREVFHGKKTQAVHTRI